MINQKSDMLKRFVRYYGTLIVAILVFVFFSVSANGFFTVKNVMLLLKQMSAICKSSFTCTVVTDKSNFFIWLDGDVYVT